MEEIVEYFKGKIKSKPLENKNEGKTSDEEPSKSNTFTAVGLA